MAGIRIVTDSACDLPDATAAKHHIDIVPLTVRFGETEYVDRRDLTPKEFWVKTSQSKTLPETAAPSPGAFEECFRNAAAQGATGVVCVALSSGLSATIQSAQLAAEAVSDTIPVRVIDSRNVTIAQGLLAITGAEAAGEDDGLHRPARACPDARLRFACAHRVIVVQRQGRGRGSGRPRRRLAPAPSSAGRRSGGRCDPRSRRGRRARTPAFPAAR